MAGYPNMTLDDLNGRVWSLSEANSPIRIAVDGKSGVAKIRGLQGAPWKLEERAGVTQPGVTVVGRTDDKSIVSMDLRCGFFNTDALQSVRDFADGLGRGVARGGRMMRLTCLDSGRFQEVRLAELLEFDWTRIATIGMQTVTLALQSDESWWRGKPVDKTFTPAEFAGARVINRSTTDLGSWPWIRIEGPITNPTLGFDGEQVKVPVTLAAGQWVEIETDPDQWSVRNQSGADLTWAPSVGYRWHKRVPSRSTKDGGAPLYISGTGTTSATKVRVVVPQLFEAAL